MDGQKIGKWIDDFDNLVETGHFDNQKIEEFVHHHKEMDMKQFLSEGREIIRQSYMYKTELKNNSRNMTPEEKYKNEIMGHFQFPRYSLKEIIGMFDNGFERYQTDTVFNKCIDAIHHGENPIKLLDQVIKMQADLTKIHVELVKKLPPQPIIIKQLNT